MEINEFYKRYYEFTRLRRSYLMPKNVLNIGDEFSASGTYPIIESVVKQYKGPAILDIGAGHRKLDQMLGSYNVPYDYKSVDKATNIEHDFQDIYDIKENKFDIIFLLELIEHLALKDGLLYLSKAFDLLNRNGTLIISTPNVHHINQLWKSNISHIQQYPGSDLCAILRMIGFSDDLKIYRLFIKPKKRSVKRYFKHKLEAVITSVLGVDNAYGILVIAKK